MASLAAYREPSSAGRRWKVTIRRSMRLYAPALCRRIRRPANRADRLIGGLVAHHAEIVGRAHDALAHAELPDAIHHHAGGQRIIRRGQPVGKRGPPACGCFGNFDSWLEDARHGGIDGIERVLRIAHAQHVSSAAAARRCSRRRTRSAAGRARSLRFRAGVRGAWRASRDLPASCRHHDVPGRLDLRPWRSRQASSAPACACPSAYRHASCSFGSSFGKPLRARSSPRRAWRALQRSSIGFIRSL